MDSFFSFSPPFFTNTNTITEHGRAILSKCTRNPLSIQQAQTNVSIALKVLRSRRYSAIPSPYLHQPEAIVKGHRAVLWGLLWHLKRTIDTFVPDPTELHTLAGRTPSGKAVLRQNGGRGGSTRRVSFFDQSSTGVRVIDKRSVSSRMAMNSSSSSSSSTSTTKSFHQFYTSQEQWQLERSLLSWLYSLGALVRCYPSYETGVPQDLTDIESQLRNGTLLCITAEIVTNGSVKGWMKKPKTEKVGRSNIEKGLTLLRETKDFGQRFTWSGDNIHHGSRHDILGLLEDCHRYQVRRR